jgi:hypothetical protein
LTSLPVVRIEEVSSGTGMARTQPPRLLAGSRAFLCSPFKNS